MRKFFIIVLIVIIPTVLFCQEELLEKPDGYFSNATLKIAYFFGTLDLIEKMPPVPDDLIEYKDIVYRKVQDRSLKLDIYHTKELKEERPVLIFIHGGAWKKGDKVDYRRYLVDYAKKGYVTVTVQYSLSKIAKFPAAVSDIKCAIEWIKNNSEKYFIDPNKIALIGGSAGGHLSMMVGYSDYASYNECIDSNGTNKVQAIVNLYGPADLTTEYARSQSSVEYFLGKKYKEDNDIFNAASPVSYLTKDDPPTLIFQGTLDELVPYTQADSLISKLDRVGIPAEYHKLEGWPHTMDLGVEVNEYCQYYMDRFFEKYIPFKKEN